MLPGIANRRFSHKITVYTSVLQQSGQIGKGFDFSRLNIRKHGFGSHNSPPFFSGYSDDSRQRSKVKGQMTEVREQMTEVRGRMTDDRRQRLGSWDAGRLRSWKVEKLRWCLQPPPSSQCSVSFILAPCVFGREPSVPFCLPAFQPPSLPAFLSFCHSLYTLYLKPHAVRRVPCAESPSVAPRNP